MKNIIVFGASGDTGKYLIEYFLNSGLDSDYKLIACGTKETDYFSKIDVEYVRIDITNKDDFNKLPSESYAVIDLAGLMPARMKGYDPQKYIDVNIYKRSMDYWCK